MYIAMTIEQALKTFENKKQSIMDSYGKLIDNIHKLESQLNDISTDHPNNSKAWITEKQGILMRRIESAKAEATKFLNTNLQNIKEELDETKKDVEEWIKDQIKAILSAQI